MAPSGVSEPAQKATTKSVLDGMRQAQDGQTAEYVRQFMEMSNSERIELCFRMALDAGSGVRMCVSRLGIDAGVSQVAHTKKGE